MNHAWSYTIIICHSYLFYPFLTSSLWRPEWAKRASPRDFAFDTVGVVLYPTPRCRASKKIVEKITMSELNVVWSDIFSKWSFVSWNFQGFCWLLFFFSGNLRFGKSISSPIETPFPAQQNPWRSPALAARWCAARNPKHVVSPKSIPGSGYVIGISGDPRD